MCLSASSAGLADRAVAHGRRWVVTGGSRGITAECALELGKRFQLKLHLLGTTPQSPVDPTWRDLSAEALKQLRTDVMRQAKAAGRSMEGEWSRIQKNIEIDRVLRTFAAAGVEATYHACDVGDRDSLAAVLDMVRRTSGPIEGVLHGAGVERSGGYEKKSRENVDATLRSKVDGALNLARLTAQRSARVVYRLRFGQRSIGLQRSNRLLPGQRRAGQACRLVSARSGRVSAR